MTTWFFSDPHFGHKNILKFEPIRDFIDVEHMDNTIIENYNNTVKDGDIVFWLGDMFFCNTPRMEYICNRLKLDGKRNIVIRGNHDKGMTDAKFKRLGFMPVKMYYYAGMILTHHPMTESNLHMLSSHLGKTIINVHGHTHGLDTKLDPFRWQCVSMEKTDFKPLTWTQVVRRTENSKARNQWVVQTGSSNSGYFKTEDHLR